MNMKFYKETKRLTVKFIILAKTLFSSKPSFILVLLKSNFSKSSQNAT